MILTGIEKIDNYLDGGIERGSIALLNSEPGVKLVEFLLHLIRIQDNLKTLYIVNNKKPELVDSSLSKLRIEDFHILDCFSGLMCVSSGYDCVTDPDNVENVYDKISSLIEEQRFDIVAFDSLTMLYDQIGEAGTRNFIKKLSDLAVSYKFIPVFLFTSWDEDKGELENLRDLFDYIIDLKIHRKKLVGNEMINIAKARGKKVDTSNFPYKLIETGIRLFVPKILVTGPYFAGKTTIIHALSTKAVSVDREKTTVALDLGHIDYKGFSVDLFGTPGQKRFDPIIKQLAKEAMGIILVVDSSDPDSFARANEIIDTLIKGDIPTIVIANKQDLDNALDIKEIRSQLNIKEDVHIIRSSAINKENLDNILQLILDLIFR